MCDWTVSLSACWLVPAYVYVCSAPFGPADYKQKIQTFQRTSRWHEAKSKANFYVCATSWITRRCIMLPFYCLQNFHLMHFHDKKTRIHSCLSVREKLKFKTESECAYCFDKNGRRISFLQTEHRSWDPFDWAGHVGRCSWCCRWRHRYCR